MSSGAETTAHMENCALIWRSVMIIFPDQSCERSRHGSFQPPGPASSAKGARMSMFVITPFQFESSGPVRQALPSVLPTGAYHSFQPHSENRIGRPVALRASRIAPYCLNAVGWSPGALQLSSFK